MASLSFCKIDHQRLPEAIIIKASFFSFVMANYSPLRLVLQSIREKMEVHVTVEISKCLVGARLSR